MKQKRHSVDEIVAKLRQADVELGKGKKVPEVCKSMGITEQTYYHRMSAEIPIFRTISGTDVPDSC